MIFFVSGEEIDQTGIDRMIAINKLVYFMAKDDDLSDVSPSQDPCFLNEWFINEFSRIDEVSVEMWVFSNIVNNATAITQFTFIFNRNPSNHEFDFVFQPIRNTTKASARSPLFYECILNRMDWIDQE